MSHQNPDLFKDSFALGKLCGLCFAEDPYNFGCPICQSSRSALWIVSDSHGVVILVAIQRMIGVYHFLSVSEDKQLLQLVLLHKAFRDQNHGTFLFLQKSADHSLCFASSSRRRQNRYHSFRYFQPFGIV